MSNNSSYIPIYMASVTLLAMQRRWHVNKNNRIHHKTKEHIMKKETLQEYLNKQVKVIDVLQNEVAGTLINLTDDSLVLQTSRNNVVISYDYVVQFLVKNSI